MSDHSVEREGLARLLPHSVGQDMSGQCLSAKPV